MRKLVRNNDGIALITVVIGVMFCLLLTSTMLRVSLLGLQSRNINNQVSDTFYDAEGVVDSIRLNLQNTAAEAWTKTSNETSSYNFVAEAYHLITGKDYATKIATGSLSIAADDTDGIDLVKKNLTNNNSIPGGTVESFGAIEKFIGETGNLEGLKIKNVKVKYENPTTHMVSYVETDIIIRAPLYASKKKFPLASYSMFAGSGATLYNTNSHGGQYGNPNQFGFLEQEGNVYIGYSGTLSNNEAKAIDISGRETFILSGGNVVINGSVYLSDYSNLQLTGDDVEIRGKIFLGEGCHLIIGTGTNLKCRDIVIGGSSVANGQYTFSSNGKVYYGTPYRCFTTWTNADGSSKVGGLDNGTKTESAGNPTKRKSGNVEYYPNYVDNAASIVYIDSTNIDTARAYDAYVYGASNIKTQQGTKLTITTDLDDSDLYPKPRRSTQRVVTANDDGGYASTHGKTYDDYFLEIIDLEYFEQFMYDYNSLTQNHPINNRIKSSVYKPDSEKNEPTSSDAFEGSGITKITRQDDEGNTYRNENGQTENEEFESVTFSGINYTYTAFDGATRSYKNPRVAVIFTGSTNTGNGNLVHSKDRPFVVSNYDVTFHVDKNDADYCGIIFTSGHVELKKDQGYCAGKSLLNLDTTPTLTNLKNLMDTIGAHMSGTNVAETKYVIFNNLFNGGIKRFYDRPSSNNDSQYQVDTTHNSVMDFIDTENFNKE